MPGEMIDKTAYYCESVDRFVTRLTERYERQGDIDLSDIIHVARSVLRDIERLEGIRYEFPVGIGETVKCVCEEEDEYENPVASLVPYRVAGVAFFKGKHYVLDDCREMYEIGTRYCILSERDISTSADAGSLSLDERDSSLPEGAKGVEYASEI